MYSWMWSLWVMGVLAAGSPRASAASFPEHMLVSKAGDDVTVKCPVVSSDITWKIGDEEMSVNGPEFQITELDEDSARQYSCWHRSQRLATVYVVLEDTPDSRIHPLECWAESYVNCSFKCNWADPNYPLARLWNERSNGSWVLASPDDGLFHVSHNISAHHEEDAPIKVTVEALTANKDRLVKINKTFFLKDIIRPPAPQVTVCRNKTGAALDMNIRPAGSWPLPSYFPLEYEVEYLKKDNGELKTQLCCKEQSQTKDCWTNVRCTVSVRVAKFHVRARDPLVKSVWGPWTEWMNGGTRARHGRGEASMKNCEGEEDKPKGKGRKRNGDGKRRGKGQGKGKGRGKGKGKRKGNKNSHTCNDTQP